MTQTQRQQRNHAITQEAARQYPRTEFEAFLQDDGLHIVCAALSSETHSIVAIYEDMEAIEKVIGDAAHKQGTPRQVHGFEYDSEPEYATIDSEQTLEEFYQEGKEYIKELFCSATQYHVVEN